MLTRRESRWRLLTVIIAFLLGLAACGSGDADGTTTTSADGASTTASADGATTTTAEVTTTAPSEPIVLDFPSPQVDAPGFGEWWAEVIAEFESRHPNVTIDFNSIPYDVYHDTLATRFAAGDPPDIVHLHPEAFQRFASEGWLLPIDDRLAETDIPENWLPFQSEMLWEGQTMGVLQYGWAMMLYYNQALLDEAGLAVPTTPDEFIAAAETLTRGEVFGVGLNTAQDHTAYTQSSAFVTGNTGHHWAEGDEWMITDTDTIDALSNVYLEAIKYAPPGADRFRVRELFANGRIAMLIEGPWMNGILAANATPEVLENVRIARPPFEFVYGGGGPSSHIPSMIAPERQDLVWEFILLTAEPEWQLRYAELAGLAPGRIVTPTDAMFEENPLLAGAISVASEATFPEYPVPHWVRERGSEFTQLLSEAIIEIQVSNQSVAEVMADLQDELERAGITP